MRTSPPRDSMKRRDGSAYNSSSGHNGSASDASLGPPPNICASTAANGGAAALRTDWFIAASASGSHNISLMRAVWPLLISHSSTVSPGDAAMRVGVCPWPLR